MTESTARCHAGAALDDVLSPPSMSRTPLDPALVHDRAAIIRDARRIDALCDVVRPVIQDFVREAIAYTTTSTLASEFVDPAAAQIIAGGTTREAVSQAHDSLRDAMHAALPTIDEAWVTERTREIAQMLLAAWIGSLWDGVEAQGHLSLLDGFFADERSRDRIAAAASDEGVRNVAVMLTAIRDALLGSNDVLSLPGAMQLEVVARSADGSMHVTVRRNADERESVGNDVAQSGTRAKDGVVTAPDRAKQRG